MPPVAAAVVPHPPLLVPELAGAAAGELDPLRAACGQALAAVLTGQPQPEPPAAGEPGPPAFQT